MWALVASFLAGVIVGAVVGLVSTYSLYRETSGHLDEAIRLLSARDGRALPKKEELWN